MPYQLIWLIFFLPLISFAIIAIFIRPFVKPGNRIAGYITITAIAGSLALSVWALLTVMGQPNHEIAVPSHQLADHRQFHIPGRHPDGLADRGHAGSGHHWSA